MEIRNPFDAPGNWYKANFHTHTTASDGEFGLVERAREYRERGYAVLAITDHNYTTDVAGLSDSDFLVLGGLETHPDCPGCEPYHFVCLNVPHGFDCSEGGDPNERLRMVREAGGEVILAHPYWCGHNINHLLAIDGVVALEVYNSTCTKIGKGLSSVHWDDLLDAGSILPAVAVDDVHRGRDKFMGWTMLKAESLSTEQVMAALRTGCYYSSCGPVIEDFRVVDGQAMVRCSPAAEVHFIAQRANGCSFFADGGEPITSLEKQVGSGWKYVRVEIVDRRGNRAWTNPIVLE